MLQVTALTIFSYFDGNAFVRKCPYADTKGGKWQACGQPIKPLVDGNRLIASVRKATREACVSAGLIMRPQSNHDGQPDSHP